jgi:hypothetical protein
VAVIEVVVVVVVKEDDGGGGVVFVSQVGAFDCPAFSLSPAKMR